MKKIIPMLLCLFVLAACQPSLQKRLKSEMISAPQGQSEIDKNLILQYAIDNKADIRSTASGIYYIISDEGEGDIFPTNNSKITAHYHGTLLNGEIFDSSVDRDQPFNFQLGQVIKGWQEAIPMLRKGGKGKFFIPSELAYGKRAIGKIPANSVLIFDIELIDFKNQL